MTQEVHQAKFMMLPPAPDVCQECAVKHDPMMPHNRDSLYYQYAFYGKHGRWPTWADAMQHCPEEIKQYWIEALTEKGIDVGGQTEAAEAEETGGQ